ncbi:hypothetical protein JZ751_013336 [Albula glossodonta]|uniref:Uncharacterized protein n=1 Tax=Albula glossodonta TaxID=121402 RepID=A0A8T2P5K7_9TELE|nr:hypothetical protein JZ751_013336 [Albula glossodonta]
MCFALPRNVTHFLCLAAGRKEVLSAYLFLWHNAMLLRHYPAIATEPRAKGMGGWGQQGGRGGGIAHCCLFWRVARSPRSAFQRDGMGREKGRDSVFVVEICLAANVQAVCSRFPPIGFGVPPCHCRPSLALGVGHRMCHCAVHCEVCGAVGPSPTQADRRKSLRDQWLMEAPPVASSPLEEPQSQGPKEQQKENVTHPTPPPLDSPCPSPTCDSPCPSPTVTYPAPPPCDSPLPSPAMTHPAPTPLLQTESPRVAEEEEQKLKDLGDGKTHPDKVTPDTSEWRAETLGGDTEHLALGLVVRVRGVRVMVRFGVRVPGRLGLGLGLGIMVRVRGLWLGLGLGLGIMVRVRVRSACVFVLGLGLVVRVGMQVITVALASSGEFQAEHMEQETGEGNQLPEGQRPNPQTAPGLDPQTLMAPLENGGEARSVSGVRQGVQKSSLSLDDAYLLTLGCPGLPQPIPHSQILGVVEVQVERDLKTGATVIRSVAPRGEAGVAAGEKVFDDGRRSIMRVVGGAGPDPDPEELGQILDVLKGAGLQAVLGGVKVVPNGKDKEDAGVEGKQQGAETKEEKEEGRGTAVERNGFEEEDNCADATHNAPQQRQEGRPSTECPQVAVGGEQQGKGTEGGGAWEGGPVTMTFLGFQELEPGSGSDAGAIIRAERVVVTDEEDETPFVSLNQQGPEPESKPDLANGEVQMEGVGQVPQHQAQGSDEGPLEVAAGGCTSQAPSSSTIQVPPPVQDTPTEEASQDTPTAQGMSTENDPPTAQTTPTEEAPPTAQNTDTEEAPPTAQTTPTEEALPTAQTTPTEEAPSTAQTTATEEAQPTAQGTPTEEAPPTATEEAPPIAQDTPTEEAPPTALETPMEEAQKEGGASGAGRVEGGLSSALVAQMKPPQVAPPGGAGGGVQWEGANQPVTHRVGQRPPATAAELQPLVPPPKASAQPSHPQPSRANEGGAAPKQKSCQCCSVM